METGQINFIYIDLPKSAWEITLRVTFWQAFFSCLSILFMSIDTAIDDVTERIVSEISRSFKRIMEKMAVGMGSMFWPQVVCA